MIFDFKKFNESLDSPLLKLSNNIDYDLIELVKNNTIKGSRILEISCGNGSDAKYLASLGYRVKCTEISKVYCDNARSIGLNCIVHDTKDKFPFMDKEFDLIYSRLGLHYFKRSELFEIFKELNRISNKIVFSVKITDDSKYDKVILTEDNWRKIVSIYFDIEKFDIKNGLLYGEENQWIEIVATAK